MEQTAQEFNLIDDYFKPLSQPLSAGDLGIGDDGAVLSVPVDHQLVVVTDTLVAGVHFPLFASPYDIGWKALAVNLSDLAAMGAKPGFYSLALTLPQNDQAWLSDFARGMRDLAAQYAMPLIGGDTTKGPLTITVTAQGWVARGQALLRSGAAIGDLICVTGVLGEGALGLKLALPAQPMTLNDRACNTLSDAEKAHALNALNRPVPQLHLGQHLFGMAQAGIDISDGLLADFGHVLNASSARLNQPLTATIKMEQLPISTAMQRYIAQTDDWSLVLSGGDDYQLCLSVAPEQWPRLTSLAHTLGVTVTAIGQVTLAKDEKEGDRQRDRLSGIELQKDGIVYQPANLKTGFSHF